MLVGGLASKPRESFEQMQLTIKNNNKIVHIKWQINHLSTGFSTTTDTLLGNWLMKHDTKRQHTASNPAPTCDLFNTALAAGWDLHGGPSFHFLFPLFGIWPAMKIGIWYTLFQEVRCRGAVRG